MQEEADKYAKARAEAKELGCTQYIDTMVYCLCPPNQTRTYYRTGKPDSCGKQFEEMYACLRLKLKMTDEARYDMLRKLQRKDEHSPTHEIWEFRQDAEKSWNEIK